MSMASTVILGNWASATLKISLPILPPTSVLPQTLRGNEKGEAKRDTHSSCPIRTRIKEIASKDSDSQVGKESPIRALSGLVDRAGENTVFTG